MLRIEDQPCFILHVRPYRDTSAIVDFLSRDYGRLSAVAKGLRGGGKQRQAWRAGLQPFNLCLLGWQGRSDLKNLVDLQYLNAAVLRGEAQYCGFYVNELVERLLHQHDPHPEIFTAYSRCLDQLADVEANSLALAVPLRKFEFALLEALGYGVYLDHCSDSGEAPLAEHHYCYMPEYGLRLAQPGDQHFYAGEDLLALARGDFQSRTALAAARRLTHIALSPLLGERPLRSRELFYKGVAK